MIWIPILNYYLRETTLYSLLFQLIKKYLFTIALIERICLFKKKRKLMKNKTLLEECKCIHCQQKLEQINNSRLYWDKLILSKNLN